MKKPTRKVVILLVTNVLTLALLIAVCLHYRVPAKIIRRLSGEGRLPFFSEPYENNRNYQARLELFDIFDVQSADLLVVGDSHVSGVDWGEFLAGHDVIGRGIAGDTSAGVAARVDRLRLESLGAVLVLVGTNDVLRGSGSDDFVANMAEVVKKLEQRYPDAEIWLCTVPPLSRWVEQAESRNDRIREVNARIASMADELDFGIIGLYEKVEDDMGYLADAMTTDGVHLSAEAYALLRDSLVHKVLDSQQETIGQ